MISVILSSSNLAILSIKAIKFSWQVFLYKSALCVTDLHSSGCLWTFAPSISSIAYYNESETSKTMRIWVLPNILLATKARLRVAGMLNSCSLPTICDR